MRRAIILFASIAFMLTTACTGVQTVTKGLENQAYIQILGDRDVYSDQVTIVLDSETTFKAEVNKIGTSVPKGTVYAISTGKHFIEVKNRNQVVYSKQIFVSAQETKQITLP
tara:strand:+ start:5387 stop:5722 length:336 start_codon:yes stop_codon:yes gene_type:complete